MAVSEQQKISFITKIGPMAVSEARKRGLGNAQIWTCIAQACDESGYGTSKLMSKANAYFGIKANEYWIKQAKYGGLVFNSKTDECYDGRTYTQITAGFRAYRCMEDSVSDYFDLLSYSRYKASLNTKTVRDCITCIKNGGYATAPNYINTICNFYEAHKSLIESFNIEGKINISLSVAEQETSVKSSDEVIAKQVIAGQWGNGSDRKKNLEKAGYNYATIQKLVNSMVRK